MKLCLVNTDKEVVNAWHREFGDFPEVKVSEEEIFAVAEGCVVLPCDDWGRLSEVISPRFIDYFGSHLLYEIRRAVLGRAGARLFAGEAIALSTGDNRIPELIVASTRGLAGHIPPETAYHAMRAAFRVIDQQEVLSDSIYCTGLEPEKGRVSAQSIAEGTARAYRERKSGAEDCRKRRRCGSAFRERAISRALR